MNIATAQPWPSSPIRFSVGTIAPSKKTSASSSVPLA
jgi:hypothetical protein